MDQSLKLNILSFDHETNPVTLSFFKEAKDGFRSLSIYEAPLELKDLMNANGDNEIKQVYTDFITTENADYTAQVDLTKSVRFAKHYYTHLIRQYLKNKVDFINHNFVNDIEAWIKSDEHTTPEYNTYKVFGLRVQIARITKNPELVVYYQGKSRIVSSSINELWEIPQEDYKWVLFRNQLYHFEERPMEAKYNQHEVFPVINKDLEKIYGTMEAPNPFANKYKDLLPVLSGFVSKYLNTDGFKAIIKLNSTDFIDVPEDSIFSTRLESNFIQLGLDNKVSVFTPKENLKQYGPYKLPENTNVKFIVIYHKSDKDYANKLYMYMKKLYKKPDGKMMTDIYGTSLYDFIRINFDLDVNNSIQFDDELNPYEAIHNFIDKTDIDLDKYQYVAIYLSPFKKDEPDPAKNRIYYKVKKTLLNHYITSQVIYKEHLFERKFKSYYYANIAAAILAKVGGIPWRLESTVKNELIVGVGAFKSKEFGLQYIGGAFCFSNNGEFQEFSCTSKSESYLLAAKIKVYIQEFIKKKQNIERLIIHFYKEMSNDEIAPIKKALFQLGYEDLPIFIININKTFSEDYVAFDVNSDLLIPYSGTILEIAKNQYLLFNNTRYKNSDIESVESYHFPIKLSFQCTHKEMLKDKGTIKDMIDQIYQFSRMYWKSVKQQNLPVTIKYPELVAKMFPYLEVEEIPEFGRTNLWFL